MTTDDAAPERRDERSHVYTCEAIEVLEGLDPVRRRPGMYIGDVTDGSGLHHLVTEVIDNAVDQHTEDRCYRLSVTIHPGGAVTVEDDGPGIPVEPLGAGERLTVLEGVVTRLCYRSREEDRWCRWRGGLHGVGLGAVNALCERFVVEVRRAGRVHRFSCQRGRPDGPVAVVGATEATGTRVTLHPDPLVFHSTVFDARRLLDMLRPIAFLHPGLRIDFDDQRPGGQREAFHGRGIAAWVALLGEGQDGFPVEPLRLRAARQDMTVDVALRWTRSQRSHARLFANGHEVRAPMIARGVAKGIRQAARRAGATSSLYAWTPEKVARGLVAIGDVRGPSLEIGGACRELLDPESARLLRDAVADQLAAALERRPALLEALSPLALG